MWALIAVIVVSLIVSVAMQPSIPKGPGAQKGTVPDVKDGKRLRRVYGTVWIDDPMQLAMKEMGETPIKK
ncbi:hypothetical protein KR767_04045 [Luteibacter anthropi]|uniref:hypothetical protein n=1 Tax=Luteibacter anthropi TaxID=564369 RepID=UPI0020327487|nr:hypothetical protein [Luteibacter anthropi]URX63248.1 hypothetical protein KR767_04045 [Luteibacter anthropi]